MDCGNDESHNGFPANVLYVLHLVFKSRTPGGWRWPRQFEYCFEQKWKLLAGRFPSRVTTVTSLPSPTPPPDPGGSPISIDPLPSRTSSISAGPLPHPGLSHHRRFRLPYPPRQPWPETRPFLLFVIISDTTLFCFSIVRNSIITVRGWPRQGRRACVLLIINAPVEFILPATRQKHCPNGQRPAGNERDTVT